MYESYIGVINPMAFNYAPKGWMTCSGQLLSIAQYSAVFALLGTSFGGNGTTNFALPDLRGRRAIGDGVSPTLGTWAFGQAAGVENTTVLITQLPSHLHNVVVKATQLASESNDPAGNYLGGGGTNNYTSQATDVTMNQVEAVAAPTGGSQPINIQAPYLAMNYSICITGIFPSRN